ncbi:MAG: hypothetical protein JW709_07745 [Sedimentisphaerales bacterium]|nr:hypothetical protein [Sedimentisphaerales bacterium]
MTSAATTNRSAFTLIDVVAALVILTILASIAAISLRSSLEAAWLRSATDRVLGDLLLVRTAAIRDQGDRTVSFTPATCQYAAADVIDPETHQPLNVALNDYHIRQIILSGFNVDYEITFDALGLTEAEANIRLRCGKRSNAIQVKKSGEITQVTE